MSNKTEVAEIEENAALSTEDVIVQVLEGYMKQEIGNKVSQFSVQGLMQILLMALAENAKQEG